jgi:hypothetical protein
MASKGQVIGFFEFANEDDGILLIAANFEQRAAATVLLFDGALKQRSSVI